MQAAPKASSNRPAITLPPGSLYVQSTAVTIQPKQYKLTHKLTIEKFATFRAGMAGEAGIKLPIPSSPNADKLPFQFEVECCIESKKTDANKEGGDEEFSAFVRLISCETEPKTVSAHYAISIIKRDGAKLPFIQSQVMFSLEATKDVWGWYFGLRKDMLDEAKQLLSPTGALTLLFEIAAFRDEIQLGNPSVDSLNQLAAACKIKCEADYLALLRSLSNINVTLVASGGKEFQINKSLLCARSSHFADILNQKGAIDRIETVTSPDVLDQLLDYVSKGKVSLHLPQDQVDRNAVAQLLLTANKYALKELADVCVKRLCLTITADSLVATLLLAEEHRLEQLKKAVIEYYVANAQAVMSSPAWNGSNLGSGLKKELFDALAGISKSSSATAISNQQ